MNDAVIVLATIPAILALVTLAKDIGLPIKLAPVLAVILGVGLAIADKLLADNPVYQAGAGGLLIGLGAAGLYDAAKIIAPTKPNIAVVNVTAPVENDDASDSAGSADIGL